MTKLETYKKLAQVKGFYDCPIWRHGESRPWYHNAFTWNSVVPNPYFIGTFKWEILDTEDKQVAFIQGKMEEGGLSFANSIKQRDMIFMFLGSIAARAGIKGGSKLKRIDFGFRLSQPSSSQNN